VKSLHASQIRAEFLEYYQSQRHQRVRSSSLIPANDPSVLLTTAGMQQFKPYFLGEQVPPERRLTSVQKCFRTSDIEAVGDETHDTFFEMLGNFSVGDYFKQGAIDFAWELLTGRWEIDRERLSVTVFGGEGPIPPDEEAEEIWKSRGLPPERIHRFGARDNFWGPPGVTGPCGPCSEIHFDVGRNPCDKGTACGPNCECGRFLEIWNLVFMQYNKQGESTFHPLPARNIDTGMGLERIALVLQQQANIFATDLFRPLLEKVGELCGLSLAQASPGFLRSTRIVSDHIRGATFLVCDGVLPSNEGRGYVLRRILRRALVHGRKLGRDEPFVEILMDRVIEMYRDAYPELAENRNFISRVLGSEEQRFLETLETGIRIFQSEQEKAAAAGEKVLPGPLLFKLYDTYGFPPEITEDLARERGLEVDREGFEACMEEQRDKARASWKGTQASGLTREGELAGIKTEFVGYERLEITSVILRLFRQEQRVESLGEGEEALLVVERTPFYGESGGQAGDRGLIQGPRGVFEVLHTLHGSGEVVLHRGRVLRGEFREREEVLLQVDRKRREATARNHTATHLLHYALRRVLGDHVRQSGSLVAPERLRFDFTHFAPLREEEIDSLEEIVNERIRENQAVRVRQLDFHKAQEEKAIALFGEKYGDEVRMVCAGDFSKELCGGTHVLRTGDIGFFKTLHESSVAAGIRRIEALTGEAAVRHVQQLDRELRRVSLSLQARPGELVQRVLQLQQRQKDLEKQQKGKSQDRLQQAAGEMLQAAEQLNGIPLVTGEFAGDAETLRKLADLVRDRLGTGVILLASRQAESTLLILSVTRDLTSRLHAGRIIGEIAGKLGGKGGGRPDMAQAGIPHPDRTESVFAGVREILARPD